MLLLMLMLHLFVLALPLLIRLIIPQAIAAAEF